MLIGDWVGKFNVVGVQGLPREVLNELQIFWVGKIFWWVFFARIVKLVANNGMFD